jgi:hypothetical protein
MVLPVTAVYYIKNISAGRMRPYLILPEKNSEIKAAPQDYGDSYKVRSPSLAVLKEATISHSLHPFSGCSTKLAATTAFPTSSTNLNRASPPTLKMGPRFRE